MQLDEIQACLDSFRKEHGRQPDFMAAGPAARRSMLSHLSELHADMIVQSRESEGFMFNGIPVNALDIPGIHLYVVTEPAQ